jgi:integrase/recombinase XerD
MANWEAKLIVHREEKRIGIKADDNPYMNGEIRKFNDARWSKTLRCWHVPDTPFNRLRWNIELEEPESDEEIELQKKKTNERSNFVSQEIQKYLKDFRYYLKSMRYGENTIDVYSNALLSFLKFNSEKPIKELNNDDIIIYVNEYIVKKKLSISYHNQVFNAIKIFFEKVCKSKIETEKVFRPRKEKKLPNVLSKIEVKTILERTINNKHRTMLSLTYACGLRSGEVLSLKPKDIDSERNLMIVRQGKGKKDRVVPIGDKMIELLRVYYIQYQPKEVFLVAPTTHSINSIPVSSYVTPNNNVYINQGYTWNDAKKICLGYGGDLATYDELQRAYKNGGNWCPAGWINDNENNRRTYYLPSNTNKCGLTIIPPTPVAGMPVSNSSGIAKAFAICNAPKPADPTISVHNFNNFQYSMIPDMLLSAVTDGSGADLFPLRFTPSQGYYALFNEGIETNNEGIETNGKFSWSKARNWLKTNYNTVDSNILGSQGYTDNPSNWTNLSAAVNRSCELIRAQDDTISQQILILQNHFIDISGYVVGAFKAKNENSKFQGMLYDVCRGTTPASSPACAKLATLDFDLFYTNPTVNTLADLEELNNQIFLRREEICQMLYNIRLVRNTLGCTYQQRAQCQGCVLRPATSDRRAVNDCSNTTLFDLNNVAALKYSLEEISPLFEIPAYKEILSSVMENLSYIVEAPSLASFENIDSKAKYAKYALTQIKELVPDIHNNAIRSNQNQTTISE